MHWMSFYYVLISIMIRYQTPSFVEGVFLYVKGVMEWMVI